MCIKSFKNRHHTDLEIKISDVTVREHQKYVDSVHKFVETKFNFEILYKLCCSPSARILFLLSITLNYANS